MGERIDLAKMADVSGLFKRVLADGADVDVFDGSVRQLLRVVERGQSVEPIVGNFGNPDVGLARVAGLRGKMRLSEDAEQLRLAYLGHANNTGFHKKGSSY